MSLAETYTDNLRAMPSARRVLLLAGTTEAAAIARTLDGRDDLDVVASFAGATLAPRPIARHQRIGGFGGVNGLAAYLRAERIDVLVDATHPFAARMRWHAHDAATAAGTARVRVERPAWEPVDGDRWHEVDAVADAPAALDRARRIFLTTGRQELAPFASLADRWFLIRSIDPPDPLPLPHAHVVLSRGPFTVDDERALMAGHRIDTLVTKNSGGEATAAKLTAARDLGIPVVMVRRPPNPPGPLVTTADEAVAWLAGTRP